ncbi:MAG: YopX family protein [Helicobacter sp.]|nr:YopX family protein [Helicobacter sp.]
MKLQDFGYRLWDKENKSHVRDFAFLPTFDGYCILAKVKSEWHELDDTERFEIELFSGVVDRHGYRIYEGDVVYYGGNKFCVIYNNGEFLLTKNMCIPMNLHKIAKNGRLNAVIEYALHARECDMKGD